MPSNTNNPQSASLSAQNTFTTSDHFAGQFPLRIRGTWAGTITLQRSDDGGTTFDDVETWTSNVVRYVTEAGRNGAQYRIGFKTSEYSSGTAEVQLG